MDRVQTARQRMIDLFGQFEDKYIIGLKSRPDRRRRIEKDLANVGLTIDDLGIRYFDGLVFDEAAGFPGIGVRGCFNSHRTLMRRCADNGRPMIVMEDDVDFDIGAFAEWNLDTLHQAENWGIIYFGYLEPEPLTSSEGLVAYDGGTIGGHFYAVKPEFADAVATYMEGCLLRAPGDPDGGPMYRDAAFTMFRRRAPEYTTLLSAPPLAAQFSSRSDLALRPKLYDRLPLVREAVGFLRALRLDRKRAEANRSNASL